MQVYITQRAYSGQADLQQMLALVRQFPANNPHVVDLPYRLCSWAFDYPDNVGLWFDDEQQLVAWAVLQPPFWAIDYACLPAAPQDIHKRLLEWADGRARQAVGMPGGLPAWYVSVFADQAERIRDLEELGFASQADMGEDSWSQVFMTRSAQMPVVECPLPAGFAIRPLAGESKVAAYVELQRAVFGTENMTVGWRARTLRQPDYIADLDLVAVAPDGRLAAFCICWLDTSSASGQIEPMGVHADWRKLGLGQAILSEGLRRLQRHGAQTVYVETDRQRNAALALYQSVGFRVTREILIYRKDYL